MALEDVLRQQEEILNFLRSLVLIHRKALQDEKLSFQLSGIRKDIYVCFNDLCKLNEMLIVCDGEIKMRIKTLEASKEKFAKLAEREIKLQDKRKKWSIDSTSVPVAATRESISISSSYRSLLEQYIELIGANNTFLAAESTNDERLQDGNPNREQLLQSIEVLQACHEESTKDIKQLESLLRDFRKDQALITKELKFHQTKIRHEIDRINGSIAKLHESRKKLLAKVGLAIPVTLEPSSLSHRLFNLQLNEENKKREQEQQDIADHASEFIDMKIRSLQDQLTYKKEDSSTLVTQKNVWRDCIQSIKNLEDRLSGVLNDHKDFPSAKMKNWLKETIGELNVAITVTDSDILVALIADEREVIERALLEISNGNVQPRNIPHKNRYHTSPSHSHSSPPFLVASKSPPKIGITDQTIDPSNNANNIELEDMDFSGDKFEKRD